ncbi:MAG: SET domain-containing protein-lysine N-methyltransferase [Maricaulaceae bacterium]|nr:SET domain-containing protein-lysine N-methyltransferase [Maricaulaceae bacterium]
MLLVDTYIGSSAIEGVGVFAAEPVKKGQLIYRFEPGFDRLICKDELALMPESIRRFIDRYTYPHPVDRGCLVLDADNGRHMNHSENPNTDFRDAVFGYAIRDIAAGEEITCNYSEFEPDFVMLPSMTAAFAKRKRNGATRHHA